MSRLFFKWPYVTAAVALAILALSVYLVASGFSSKKPAPSPQPKITWSEEQVEVILSPSENMFKDVTFTSTLDIKNIIIEAVPEIAGFVSIQPNSFASVPANQVQSVRLSFLIPQGAILGTYEGTVHVRVGSQTLPQTLKVTVDAWKSYENPELGVSFSYPPTMTLESLSDAQGLNVYIHDANEEFPNGIGVRRYSRDLTSILNEITASLRVVSQTEQTLNGQTWILYTFVEDESGLEFVDAFTVFNGTVYQVGGKANASMTSALPKILTTFNFP